MWCSFLFIVPIESVLVQVPPSKQVQCRCVNYFRSSKFLLPDSWGRRAIYPPNTPTPTISIRIRVK